MKGILPRRYLSENTYLIARDVVIFDLRTFSYFVLYFGYMIEFSKLSTSRFSYVFLNEMSHITMYFISFKIKYFESKKEINSKTCERKCRCQWGSCMWGGKDKKKRSKYARVKIN